MGHRYRDLSDAQANAEALARRGLPYQSPSQASFSVAWDYRQRMPRDLREATRMVRFAYADEVPTKIHEGYDSIGPDGTPKMTVRAEGYIFGHAQADDAKRDAETGKPEAVGHYFAPFRARLDAMGNGGETERRFAAIVGHVTIGSQGPKEAAIREGIPSWAAALVAYEALRCFLAGMSDLNVHLAESHTAA